MDGYAVNPADGTVTMEADKYLHNLLRMPLNLVLLLAGLVLVVLGVVLDRFTASVRGIWPAGLGTVLTCARAYSSWPGTTTPLSIRPRPTSPAA